VMPAKAGQVYALGLSRRPNGVVSKPVVVKATLNGHNLASRTAPPRWRAIVGGPIVDSAGNAVGSLGVDAHSRPVVLEDFSSRLRALKPQDSVSFDSYYDQGLGHLRAHHFDKALVALRRARQIYPSAIVAGYIAAAKAGSMGASKHGMTMPTHTPAAGAAAGHTRTTGGATDSGKSGSGTTVPWLVIGLAIGVLTGVATASTTLAYRRGRATAGAARPPPKAPETWRRWRRSQVGDGDRTSLRAPHRGNEVVRLPDADGSTERERFCGSCGDRVGTGSRFCSSCGAPTGARL
jgi:hypothetical protein